ncbi:MAG: hypothetical protein J7L15_02845, partial [Clostridiales bacterium]|nr:hypothetical protein [Clostridiales bacterium]
VLVYFVVLSILITSVYFVVNNNTKQVASQENRLRAYYVARSGIDIAYAALMQADTDGYEKKVDRLIENDDSITQVDLNIPKNNPIGTVTVTVDLVDDEVEIHAESIMLDNGETYSLSFYFNVDNFEKNRWIKE